jgi:hypothetical protein
MLYKRDVLPILIGYCARSGCHGATTQKKGYNLTSYNIIIAKGIVKFNAAGLLVEPEDSYNYLQNNLLDIYKNKIFQLTPLTKTG